MGYKAKKIAAAKAAKAKAAAAAIAKKIAASKAAAAKAKAAAAAIAKKIAAKAAKAKAAAAAKAKKIAAAKAAKAKAAAFRPGLYKIVTTGVHAGDSAAQPAGWGLSAWHAHGAKRNGASSWVAVHSGNHWPMVWDTQPSKRTKGAYTIKTTKYGPADGKQPAGWGLAAWQKHGGKRNGASSWVYTHAPDGSHWLMDWKLERVNKDSTYAIRKQLATAEASLKKHHCAKDTGGTCAFMQCFASRKAQCTNKKCMCPSGTCSNNSGVCVKESAAAAKSRADATAEVNRLKALLA